MANDETIQCKECEQDFIFTAKEQEFFQSKGFMTPRRCKTCIRTGFKKADGLTASERQAKYEEEHQNA